MSNDYRPPWNAAQVYTFTGQLATSSETKNFVCLAGDGAPTIKGGFTKINTIDRPRRKGFTMPVGWDPISLDVPVRFEAVTDYGAFSLYDPAGLEDAIQILEWMAGRGKKYDNGSHPAEGDPPTVWVASYLNDGQTATHLIPENLHGGPHPSLTFLISSISYDEHPIRGGKGDRHRQDAVISLIEQVTVPGTQQTIRERQHGRGSTQGYVTFVSNHFQNSIEKLCRHHGIFSPAVWRKVVAFNRDRLHVRSYLQPLRPGTRVQVPKSLLGVGFKQ